MMIPMVGLVAALPVKWLVMKEPEVKKAVADFAAGRADCDYVDVVAPPPQSELTMMKLDPSRHRKMELPLIRLRMKITSNFLHHTREVTVTCDEPDMQKIVTWFAESNRRNAAKMQDHDLRMAKMLGNA